MKRREREYKEVQEQEKKYPKTKRAYRELVTRIAKEFGEKAHVVDNTIREKGLGYTLAVLERRGRKAGGGGWLRKMAEWLRRR